MRDGLQALTEREKQALRLLMGGHDAKSAARNLGLSVHTVNERLRDARRKLDVSSSREAARWLAETEEAPDFLADKELGVPNHPAEVVENRQAASRRGAGHPLAWFGGGMLIMSLIIAAAVFVASSHGEAPQPAATPVSDTRASAAMGLGAAREWLALVDGGRWDESWRKASPLLKSQISSAQLAAATQAARQPLGPVTARTFQTVTKASALPGVPAGDYEVIQFRTGFRDRRDAAETVTLARDGEGWKVAGYFIR